MTSPPRVSVIMPVHNEEKYISFAVESILNQSLKDFELIIVDDRSTDKTIPILDAIGDSRIKLIENTDNPGIGGALNVALEHADAHYIARMDADDIAHPNRLRTQVDLLNANPNFMIVGSSYYFIDRKNRIVSAKDQPERPKLDMEYIISGQGLVKHPTVMMRKNILEQVGGYRPIFKRGQDTDLWLRLAEILQDDCVYNITGRYLYYRIDGNQLLNNNNIWNNVAVHAARLRNAGEDENLILNEIKNRELESLQNLSFGVAEAYARYAQFREYYWANKRFEAMKFLIHKNVDFEFILTLVRLLIIDLKLKFSKKF